MKQQHGPDLVIVQICCTGAVLGVMLALIRAQMLFTAADLATPARLLSSLAAGAYPDLAFVVGMTAAFAVACVAVRGRPAIQRAIARVFNVAAAASLLMGFVNVLAVAELGHPMNYQWLYYSHFLRSLDTYTAMADLLSWPWVVRVVLGCIALLVASSIVSRGAGWALRRSAGSRGAAVGAAVLAGYLGLVWSWPLPAGWDAAKVANPVVVLTASLLKADRNPVLAERPVRSGSEDFLPASSRGSRNTSSPYTGRARAARVRNVLIVTLESVAAQYLPGFGAAGWGITPELERHYRSARRFVSFYAHQPTTTYSLVSLLLSVYPPHSFRAVTREHPDIALPSLSGELKRLGYRTASFDAGDNRFQRADVFLSHRGFDRIVDVRSGSCRTTFARHRLDDDCAYRDLLQWIDGDSGRPFFALVWTAQTHFPYIAADSSSVPKQESERIVGQTSDDRDARRRLPRYLDALSETDRALGDLLETLEERGLLESTLIVVLGDHGEAFGQHGNAFHRKLYEEEVRVPLLLMNPILFGGEVDSVSGGIIDLAPTIMDLLGYPLPGEWQGRSLFDSERSGRVYLFGPYSGLFGLREGGRKLIYNPIANEAELYDLADDPGETNNLAPLSPETVELGTDRLAAWVQYQRALYQRLGVDR